MKYYTTFESAIANECIISTLTMLKHPELYTFSAGHLYLAIVKGSIKFTQFLLSIQIPLTYTDVAFAYHLIITGDGDLKKMQLLFDYGFTLHTGMLTLAANLGKGLIINWLIKRKCIWTPMVFANAALNGNFKILKWLRSQKLEWNEYTFKSAVTCGRISNLDWLLSEGCPRDESAFIEAIEIGNKKIIKWMIEHKFPGTIETDISLTFPDNEVPFETPVNHDKKPMFEPYYGRRISI